MLAVPDASFSSSQVCVISSSRETGLLDPLLSIKGRCPFCVMPSMTAMHHSAKQRASSTVFVWASY